MPTFAVPSASSHWRSGSLRHSSWVSLDASAHCADAGAVVHLRRRASSFPWWWVLNDACIVLQESSARAMATRWHRRRVWVWKVSGTELSCAYGVVAVDILCREFERCAAALSYTLRPCHRVLRGMTEMLYAFYMSRRIPVDPEGQDRPGLDARLLAAALHGGDGCHDGREGSAGKARGHCWCLFSLSAQQWACVVRYHDLLRHLQAQGSGSSGTSGSSTAGNIATADGIPELARSMGQATIDMLSKAKMRCAVGPNVLYPCCCAQYSVAQHFRRAKQLS
jgi:alkylated DNA nucleotide flippase Atl1